MESPHDYFSVNDYYAFLQRGEYKLHITSELLIEFVRVYIF